MPSLGELIQITGTSALIGFFGSLLIWAGTYLLSERIGWGTYFIAGGTLLLILSLLKSFAATGLNPYFVGLFAGVTTFLIGAFQVASVWFLRRYVLRNE